LYAQNKTLFLTKIDKSEICKMKVSNSDLGLYLRGLRKEIGQTLHQVSKKTDIDSPLLSKLERGERLPTAMQLKRLAKFYKVSEKSLKIKYKAEKILKEYGANETTYKAIQIVSEQLISYSKKIQKKKL